MVFTNYSGCIYTKKYSIRHVKAIKEKCRTDVPKLYAYMMDQDDPRKCTSAKLVSSQLAFPISRWSKIPKSSLILNPFSPEILTPIDRTEAIRFGLVAIDCSWKNIDKIFGRNLPGRNRRLPFLLASNPINFAKISRLSSLEALAASLYILGFEDKSKRILSLFKWGSTFYTLNKSLLNEYRNAETVEEIEEIEYNYFYSRQNT